MLVTITVGVAVFTSVMLGLVGILLLARRSLVPSGDVSIAINGGGANDLTTMKVIPRPRRGPGISL